MTNAFLYLVWAILGLYPNRVILNSITSLDIITGVLQGDVLAPFLFVIVIDYIMRLGDVVDFGFVYKQRCGSRQPAEKINDLDYADDLALLENLTSIATRRLSRHARSTGLEINISKTEFIAVCAV